MLKNYAFILVVLAIMSVSANVSPLPLRVWEFQDYHMEHIKRLIDMAAEQKINRVHLSHDILMYAMRPVRDPKLAEDINTICKLAHERGIKVDIWSRELSDIPEEFIRDKKVDLDNPKTWDAIKEKYLRLFEVCPNIDGIVITMSEGSIGIQYDSKVISSIAGPDRLAKLIDTIDEVCKPMGKDLYCRSFAYTPGDLKYIQEAIKRAKADVIAMPKCVPHDWQPFYPYSPDIGDYGGKKCVVEFDLGHEFTGLSRIPYIMLGYMKRHLDYGMKHSIDGAVYRVERMKWRAVDTPNQAVIDVASQMLQDPSADPFELYKDWLEQRYPKEAVPHLLSAFKRTEEIVENGLFVLGNWVSDHSILPNYRYAMSHLKENDVSRWDPSEHWKQVIHELLNPTAETIKKIQAEKDEALRLVEESIADIENAKPYLGEKDYDELSDLFQREKAMVVVWKAAMEVFFGIDVYRASKSDADREFLSQAAERLRSLAQENSKHLINMLIHRDDPNPTRNIDTANSLAREAESVLGQ